METPEEIQKILDKLAQQRDELIVQAQLAKLEAMDEWKNVEGKLSQLRSKTGPLKDTAKESANDIQAAAKQLADEISRGYDRLRKLF